MTTKRRVFVAFVAVATGLAVYLASSFLMSFLFFSVFSGATVGVFLFSFMKLVTLICTLLAAVFVTQKLQSEHQARGFDVILKDRNDPGAT